MAMKKKKKKETNQHVLNKKKIIIIKDDCMTIKKKIKLSFIIINFFLFKTCSLVAFLFYFCGHTVIFSYLHFFFLFKTC